MLLWELLDCCGNCRYQLFGQEVDVAQKLESSSIPGRIHASAAFLALLSPSVFQMCVHVEDIAVSMSMSIAQLRYTVTR